MKVAGRETAGKKEGLIATLVGTLPPIKGISPYCRELLAALRKRIEMEFIGFRSIYPELLYPGGTRTGSRDASAFPDGGEVRNILTYYDPVSWVRAGLGMKGKILHAQWWSYPLAPVYFTLLLLARMRGMKTVVTLHNVFSHERNCIADALDDLIIGLADRLIVHGESGKKKLSELKGVDGRRISVIPPGLLRPGGGKRMSKKDARKRLGLGSGERIVLFFGNIRDYKGLDVLLKAFGSVAKEVGGARLMIAGQPWEEWHKYRKIIDEEGLGDKIVKRLGFVKESEIERYFAASDLVVLPYKRFDSQSGVGGMALHFGRPVAVTRVGSLPDLAEDDKLVAEPEDSEGLAKVIVGVLMDKKLLKKSERDSARAAKRFAWDNTADETIKAYESALGGAADSNTR